MDAKKVPGAEVSGPEGGAAAGRPEPPDGAALAGSAAAVEMAAKIAAETLRLKESVKRLHRLASSGMMSAMQDRLQDDDLSFSQMSALHHLRTYAPMSVGSLAEHTGLSLPAASHLTDRLVGRGYALRRENPEDRRAKLLDLSAEGRQLLGELDRHFADSYRVAFAGASLSTLRTAADALERLLAETEPVRSPQDHPSPQDHAPGAVPDHSPSEDQP